jgi:predicted ester cyclase
MKTLHKAVGQLVTVPDSRLDEAAREVYEEHVSVSAFHPVNELKGRQAVVADLWRPLRAALPDMERRDELVIAGSYAGSAVVAMMGHYQGTFHEPLFDIPPTRGVVYLRYGEVHRITGSRISHSWVLIDMLDLMRQAHCWPLAPSVGAEGRWPGPATCDGILLGTGDAESSATSLQIVGAMHDALLSFDGVSLASMDLAKYWTQNFMWYGPSGIGTTRGLEGFRNHHQIPFLRAFPDRKGDSHVTAFGDGSYVVTAGWPSVVATHTGPDWLGFAPTGRRVGMRVMDFYRLEGTLIAENWVPIDIIDILRQMGQDVFQRMRHLTGAPRRDLS